MQVIALVVIVLGLPMSLIFQIFVPEDPNASPPKLKWYKWLINPKFYLVSCFLKYELHVGYRKPQYQV